MRKVAMQRMYNKIITFFENRYADVLSMCFLHLECFIQ